jgi:hypothetical protein
VQTAFKGRLPGVLLWKASLAPWFVLVIQRVYLSDNLTPPLAINNRKRIKTKKLDYFFKTRKEGGKM